MILHRLAFVIAALVHFPWLPEERACFSLISAHHELALAFHTAAALTVRRSGRLLRHVQPALSHFHPAGAVGV